MLNNNQNIEEETSFPSCPESDEVERWHVFRYRRFSKALQTFAQECEERHSVQVFLPVLPLAKGNNSLPVISSYIFIRTTASLAKTIGEPVALHPWRKVVDGIITRDLVTIPDRQMRYFIRAVESKQRNLTLADANDIDLHKDDYVRIIKGEMKGAVGYLKATPRSSAARIIITLDDPNDGNGATDHNTPLAVLRSALAFSVEVRKSDVEILRFANNDHLQTLTKRIRSVIDDAQQRQQEGEILPDRTLQRLRAYVNTISATHLTTRRQQENAQENVRRIKIILGDKA